MKALKATPFDPLDAFLRNQMRTNHTSKTRQKGEVSR
jgi:hypothetical protein